MTSARSTRTLVRTAVLLLAFITVCLLISRPSVSSLRFDRSAWAATTSIPVGSVEAKCSPDDWADGSWLPKSNPKHVLTPEDVYDASGFKGCASTREVGLHLSNNKPEKLAWRGNISAYEWTPHDGRCQDVSRNFGEDLLVELVEKGGWLLVGGKLILAYLSLVTCLTSTSTDSVTQEHFFSLSCILYPHVRATPDQARGYDHGWRQDLYLQPDSPVISRIRRPAGFDIATTPLATFRRLVYTIPAYLVSLTSPHRNDLLFNLTEVEALFNGGGWRPSPGDDSKLFGDERSWTISPSEYLSIFLAPLPIGNYRTLIVSTGGHWSLKLFAGLKGGFPEIFDLFRVVQNNFIYQVGRALDSSKEKTREVIVRPYLPGDDNCHSDKIMNGGPLEDPLSLKGASYNWAWIPRFNAAFKEAVTTKGHPNIHYLPLERPGRLRPDTVSYFFILHRLAD